MSPTTEDASLHDEEPARAHGGRAGWFRVACLFSALATIGIGYQAWSIARPSATNTVFVPSWLAAPLAIEAICFAWASFLASRHQQRAGLFLVLGYVIPAVAIYASQRLIEPPSLLVIASMLALMMAASRRHASGPQVGP